jgi:hypothetical protein
VKDSRKELIFQQSQFLRIAEECLRVKPWIAYFATIKHSRLMAAKEVSTATFDDLRDKEFSVQVEEAAENLRVAAIQALDDETKTNLDHLCVLQEISPLVLAASRTLAEIASSPHREATLAAARGTMPKGGSSLMSLSVVLIIFSFMRFGDSNEMHATGRFLTFMAILGAFICFTAGVAQSSRAGTVMMLLSKYKCDVVPLAEVAGYGASENLALEWLARPTQAQEYLRDTEITRQQFEETYLNLNDGPP